MKNQEIERLQAELQQSTKQALRLLRALDEVDVYLAALNWWHVGNIGKAGEVLGEAIGWERVRQINERYAPKCQCSTPSPLVAE